MAPATTLSIAAAALLAHLRPTAFVALKGHWASRPARATSVSGGAGGSWASASPAGATVAGLVLGAHAGLAVALRGRATRRAKEAKVAKYAETAADRRLFEKVYMDYTSEYLKGPLYWNEDKLQGALPDYPGTPMFKNGKMTSNATGNLKTFSSNELGFLAMLFLAIGLYGNIQFLFVDPQWARVDAGENFNVSYIVESLFLPISFFMHIAAYVQKQNGK